jgi:hypothetical protein
MKRFSSVPRKIALARWWRKRAEGMAKVARLREQYEANYQALMRARRELAATEWERF